jgi:glycosyltransferase involved in cell wall biosynthesis
MKKVCLFTTFFEAESGYSIIGVAETQLRALLDHGYEPIVLVQENFREPETGVWRSEMIDLRPVIPFMHLQGGVADDFEERTARVETALRENLQDVDVCIAHDVILLDMYKEHNVAVRRVAPDFPQLLWLHWIHSRPSSGNTVDYPNNSRHTAPPGYIVYPNNTDIPRVAGAYNLGGQEWRVKVTRFGHAIDPLRIWPYDPLTVDLAKASGLLEGEIACVYPARLDKGKQPEKIIRLMHGVQAAGYEPRLLVIDWQSAGDRFQKYIDQLLALAQQLGLNKKVNFTSRLDDRCSQGVPRKVVQELMDLSNVYVHPSSVETYSLVVHEAILRGNLACLNYDLRLMQELFGDAALYFDFSSDDVQRQYEPDEQQFWNDEALRLIAEFKSNRAIMGKTTARREWTPDALFKDFEPMLFLPPVTGEGEWHSNS